ncbi:hypothetical protein ABPG74_009848 [Tetrahymena malaccensis]
MFQECQILSQPQQQKSNLQANKVEKNDQINISNDHFNEHDYFKYNYKKEQQTEFLEVNMNKLDSFDQHLQRQYVRSSFSTDLSDRNRINRNHFEVICSIGSKTFQKDQIQIDEEPSEDLEEKGIQSSQSYYQTSQCENTYQNNLSQVVINSEGQPYQVNESKLIQSYQKKEFINPNMFLQNAKQEFLKFYDLKDDKQLIQQIYHDLTTKSEQKKSGEFTQKRPFFSKQKLDDQFFTFKQCVYLNLSSELSQQFISYCGKIDQNNVNQNKQGVKTAQLDNSQIHLDDRKQQNNYFNNANNNHENSDHQNKLANSQKQIGSSSAFKNLFCLKPKSVSFLQIFNFSEIRLNKPKAFQKIRDKKENSSYIKNSQFHNLNKLFMYNILSMFRIDALNNLNLSEVIIQELSKIIQRLKISSQRKHQKQSQGFYNYFTHSHYNILFLKINQKNIYQIKESSLDLDLHKQCFKIDLSKEVSEMELVYINLIKEINFQIFMVNIRENDLLDDGTDSKQNIRIKYALKAINGIKKIANGILIKKF